MSSKPLPSLCSVNQSDCFTHMISRLSFLRAIFCLIHQIPVLPVHLFPAPADAEDRADRHSPMPCTTYRQCHVSTQSSFAPPFPPTGRCTHACTLLNIV